MIALIAIGFVAGLIAGISPCVLPVLPVILVAGSSLPAEALAGGAIDAPAAPSRLRPFAVVGGLVVSFSLLVLAGSEILSLLGLPQDLLRDAGIVLLVIVGLSFLIPKLGELLERPFARFTGRQPRANTSGFVLGLALGTLFVPCAGPVLAAVTVVGATHRVGLTAVFLTVAFAIGAAVPLLAIAIAGDQISQRVKAFRQRGPLLRRLGGVVLIAMALAVALNVFTALQRDLPGYTNALQNKVEGGRVIRKELGELTGNAKSSLSDCPPATSGLVNCGQAPDFKAVTAWLNTPGGKPLSIQGLRGKVVLVDFWTYTCINCQRTLPHIEAWYSRYAKYGLEVVGVETPEFAFEHLVPNIKAAAGQLGVHYPIDVDDSYGTWNAYDNEYWPAEYLIDSQGDVRHVDFGEGNYTETESFIRQLLVAAHPGLVLPPPTSVPNLTPVEETNSETYIGSERQQYIVNTNLTSNQATKYSLPAKVAFGQLALGGTWNEQSQDAVAGNGAEMELGFEAEHVYLVLAGSGTVKVEINGRLTETVVVSGVPRLYTLLNSPDAVTSGTMQLEFTPGLSAYDFTFG